MSDPLPLPDDLSALHAALLAWFARVRADLPWRHRDDPYAVWVSEVMLQQTQVATVVPYYKRFLARFPNVQALAAAPIDEVLRLWQGLGYYRRAHMLHRAAQIVVAEHGGQLPRDPRTLQKLPGVGRYTAGAVASLAYGVDTPALDGNVIRVLARLTDLADDVGRSATQRRLWALAEALLPHGRAAAWNEGLMELGRRVCTPKSPRCAECPLAEHCEARRRGTQAERPLKGRARKLPHYDVTAGVVRGADGRVLIARRPAEKMLGGLWEFPGGKREAGESLPECLRRELREELGIAVEVGEQIAALPHAYSHFRITLYVYECRLVRGEPQCLECADWAWARLDELDGYAFPATDRQIVALLRGERAGQLGLDLGT